MSAGTVQLPPNSSGQLMQTFVNVVANTNNVACTGVAVVTSAGASCDPPSGNALAVAGTVNSNSADSGSPVKVAGVYNSSLPTAASGNRIDLQLDVNGKQLVTTNADGPINNGTAPSKSFVGGGVYNASLLTLSNTQASSLQLDSAGFLRVAGAVTATVLSANSGVGAVLITEPGQWGITHAPAVNTQATASKAAGGAGVRHVACGVSGTIGQDATGSTCSVVTLNLRDGATGAGTVLQSWTMCLANAAGAVFPFNFGPLQIAGSANTAMTLEFNAAAGVHVYESVSLTGFDVS